MSSKRLRSRLDSAKVVSSAILKKYKLMFHKVSNDGSGKCDAYFTDDINDKLFGVVYAINNKDMDRLDRFEGRGLGYERKEVYVTKFNGETIKAYTYCADNIQEGLKPYLWYKYHILHGAVENNLPIEYISFIDSIESQIDSDLNRVTLELSIYGGKRMS